MKRKTFLFIMLVIAGLLFPGDKKEADVSVTPSFKDVLNLKVPGNPLISPDGQYILYRVREVDWDKNEYISQIWMAVVKTGEIKQMTFAKESSHSYRWLPDSRCFSYKSKRGEKTQVYRMSVCGGEGEQITEFETDFNDYRWSPDGKKIAYTAFDEKSKKEKGIEKKYGKFEIIDSELKQARLWLLDMDTGKAEKIVADDDLHVASISWSPDGKRIALTTTPDSRVLSFSKADIYIVTIDDKTIKKLVDQAGPDNSPVWSPDGKTIAFNSNMGVETYFVNSEICTIPASGGKITCLTRDFDEDANLITWKKEGLYFSAFQRMNLHLFHLSSGNGRIKRITPGNYFMQGFSLNKKGNSMAFTYLNSRKYPELYYSRVNRIKPAKLTNFTEQIAKWKLATKEAVSWKSTDGAEITGVLIKPADFDPTKKYPLFVIIHGGPTGISVPQKFDRYNTYYPIEQWAAKGAVFLEPNYRGSAGFGADFRKLNYRNLGVGDYWDVISGVDHLVGLGFVDENRIAAMGWSQGGYISAYITTFSDRFKAVSVGAGISDWVTYYYLTDITPFTIHYLGTDPWEDPAIYTKTSPMTHINNAKTPTLIQHGEFDRRVPPANAYKLYRGLQDRGIPSKLIIYKGFGHGIVKPKEKLAVLTHNWNWFNRYIFGEEPPEETFEEEKDKDEKK